MRGSEGMVKSSVKQKTCFAMLSPELFKEHGVRSMQVVKGDAVTILRGSFREMEGKVTEIDRKKGRIKVEGVTREKADGTTIFVQIHTSKTMIKRLNLEDDWRKDILKRRATVKLRRESAEPFSKRVGRTSSI
jgi:large subunit ribosomal protein L24